MQTTLSPNFDIQVEHSLDALDAAEWDAFSAGIPFQSYRWYRFGERVMQDSPPSYIILRHEGQIVARASLWRVAGEPLPIDPPIVRDMLGAVLRRWPLMICRSPLSNSGGLVLAQDPSMRAEILRALADACLSEGKRAGGSFLVFDFLGQDDAGGWPPALRAAELTDPGTVMQNRWDNLEDFLAAGNKKDRQHYKRTLREAESLGIRLARRETVSDVDAALALLRHVERKYKSAPNPWARGLLENVSASGGIWMECHIGDRLVGCGLAVDDNGAQVTTALGLADDVPYVYFRLVYASLEAAFERKVRLLRWGSGAYEVKQRLGFELERNNFVVFGSHHAWLTRLGQWIA